MSIPTIFEKQLLINNITKLNPDVLTIIKDYTFHQRKTLYGNNKKKIIQEIIDVDTISSFNEGHDNQHQIFVFQSALNRKLFNKTQFQMSFCSTCGNYMEAYNIYLDRLLCKCHNENDPHELEMDDLYYHDYIDGDEQEETHWMNMNDEPRDEEDMDVDDDYYDFERLYL
jgi:hypothetical protein